ncbi:NBR1-Ig-like domain-containing protein [Actinomadura formosensis]|uniref:NBR1-Ig-like domain-containing protein n=1 Tax=Actinomadura formosensis TaxID=60706 RepID=UPI000ACF83C4|nr:NBR1-Ig-like domain-containing protein [Actinomadura formosensis]
MRAQAEAIADFAAALRELRESVGNPPFREMSGRSGAISHTTLHEATKGNRLPSWGTTAEFVKACGADPAAYRERWEKANLAVRSASAGKPATAADSAAARPSGGTAASATSTAERQAVHIAIGAQAPGPADETPASVPPPPPPADESAGDVQPALPAPGGRRRFRPARPVAVALVTAAIGVGAVGVIVVTLDRDSGAGGDGPKPFGSLSEAAPSPADCPVHAPNPASAPPMHKGDAAAFIADMTLPDCTRVGAGKTVTKVWRLKNVGKVPWKGYSLRRLDLPQQADQCQTISDVPINDTRPGGLVDIRTDITTPKKPGLCYVRFKMVDPSGRVAFPGNRPVNFQIIVEGP